MKYLICIPLLILAIGALIVIVLGMIISWERPKGGGLPR